MIDLYYWNTPNGHKIMLFLEETAVPYQIVPVKISKGEQFESSFQRDLTQQSYSGNYRPTVTEESRSLLSGQTAVSIAR